jgi:hypothetical protein
VERVQALHVSWVLALAATDALVCDDGGVGGDSGDGGDTRSDAGTVAANAARS